MATGKQVEVVRILPGIIQSDGTFAPFVTPGGGTDPFMIPAWNATYSHRTEYLGPAKIRTLSGFERQGILGYRPTCTINLRNTTRVESTNIATLLKYAGTWGATNRPTLGLSPFPVPPRNAPTVFMLSTNDLVGNSLIYNLDNSAIDIQRELSINSQIISLSFSGVYITNEIPLSAIV